MALQVNLTLSKNYFLPGEIVQVYVQIFNDADSACQILEHSSPSQQVVHVKELSFQACGSERTDSNFIHCIHQPDVPADTSDARKRMRSIFTTESAVLVSNQVLARHASQSFQLRFRLPVSLPPSFRGTAVRFLYLIQVKAVYEVHRGDSEAVVYETVASTSLMVWPSPGVGGAAPISTATGGAMTTPDRRLSTVDAGGPNSVGAGAGAALPGLPVGGSPLTTAQREFDRGTGGSRSSGTRFNTSGGGLDDVSQHASVGAAGGGGAGEEGDVPMCDYILGRKCRIRWQEVTHGLVGASVSGSDIPTLAGPSGSGALLGTAASSSSSFGSVAASGQPPLRGVIPFGVNRPFVPLFPQHPATADSEGSDLDEDSQQNKEHGRQQPHGQQLPKGEAGAGPGAPPSHVQRQLSTGMAGGGVPGLGPFGRSGPSRRASLFGKVYALNVGDQPLLRVLLQAPLEVPLQPGATFGGVLDFRQPLLCAAQSCERPATSCYDVAVLLESEEVIAPECRPTWKRDGSGLPAGAPYVVRRLHAEHHELTCDSALTSFTFSLPASATPSFRTPMVSLRWMLRFELTVGPRLDLAAMDKRARSPKPQVDQLVWSLPLIVRAPVAVPR